MCVCVHAVLTVTVTVQNYVMLQNSCIFVCKTSVSWLQSFHGG